MTDPNTPPAWQQPSYPPPSHQPQNQPPQSHPSTQPPSYPQSPSYPPSPYSQPGQPSSYPGNGTPAGPVPGRTLGIVALIGSIVIAGLSLLWLILGIVALVKSRRAGRKNGFAVAAIIISVLAFIATIVIVGYAIYTAVTIAQLCAQYGSGVYEINGVDVNITCS